MEEFKVESLNEIILEVLNNNCSEFSMLHETLLEFNDELDQEEMVAFISENYNLTSECELVDLTLHEREYFIEYLNNSKK